MTVFGEPDIAGLDKTVKRFASEQRGSGDNFQGWYLVTSRVRIVWAQ